MLHFGGISVEQHSMARREPVDIEQLFIDGKAIDRALRQAVRKAVEERWRLGYAVVEYRDGKIVRLKRKPANWNSSTRKQSSQKPARRNRRSAGSKTKKAGAASRRAPAD